MSSIHDLVTSLKIAFRDVSFSRVENELLSREEKFKREIEEQKHRLEEQRKEIEKQRDEINILRKETDDLQDQLEVVKLEKIRTEQDLREKCKDNEHCHKLLAEMDSRVLVAEEELSNFKSFRASLENREKEVRTGTDETNQMDLQRHEGDANLLVQRKRALTISECREKGDRRDRNDVFQDKSPDDRLKRMKVKDLISGLVNSPTSRLSASLKSPQQGLLQKQPKLADDSDRESSSSDDSDEDIISESMFKAIFITTAKENLEKRKWKSEAELIAAFEENGELCMKAICALSRWQNSSEKNVSGSSSSEHLGFDKLYAQRGLLLSKFLTAGDPDGKLKRSTTELNSYDAKALGDCRRIAIAHAKQLFEIFQQSEDILS